MERGDGLTDIDLDRIAAFLAATRPEVEARGLTMDEPTWMAVDPPWPTHRPDREQEAFPRSIGVCLSGPANAEAVIVIYESGWADIDYLPAGGDDVKTEHVELAGTADFEAVFRRTCTGMLNG
jgi:hypothetical protein